LVTAGRLQFAVPPAGIDMEILEEGTLPAEEARVQVSKMIKEARTMADCLNLYDARDKLFEAQCLLEESNPLLRSELVKLLGLLESQHIYQSYGRSYALSMESSQDRQRFAARGDDIRLFATPRMDRYLEQAIKFHMNPMEPVPSVDHDILEEVLADLVSIASREVERLSMED